ncbi:TetR/AcrR family transcriptional regulator [Actinomycetospora sp.]|uniref:TetR/AcrR family transcriptional regulator n=1 Tax=Actinomycetospora sp. TaxID=1872135 RepID=UPI002F3E3A9E
MSARAEAAGQTRARIVSAARERFLDAPYDDVTLAGIAADAGVSTQTVLNQFGTKEDLFLAFAAEFIPEIDALRATARPGDVRAVVRVVLRQYELMGDLNVRALELEHRLPALAEISHTGRINHQAWLEQIFADELPTGRAARRTTVHALYAATDVYLWKVLRRDLRASLAETTRVMERLVRGALVDSVTTATSPDHGETDRRTGQNHQKGTPP